MNLQAVEIFSERYGSPPEVLVRAPGRVNLIGEHTDYNDGFVLPMAIDRFIWIAATPTHDRRVSVYSANFDESVEFHLDSLTKGGPRWGEYLKGVAWSLQDAGHRLVGWEGVVAGNVPVGAGLSSSAALETATARLFAHLAGFPWNAPLMAKLCQRAENHWVGVNCGIMDQLVSAAGIAGHALLIDTRDLSILPVPLPHGATVVVLDTGTRRGLADSAYNERRAQCEAAARFFGVSALRDVTPEEFAARSSGLGETLRQRARHVITENDRTLRAAEAKRRGDAMELGKLMVESHRSLRDDFQVSGPELDTMVECALARGECYGARMTGAGFGGCAVALVRTDAVEDFVRAVSSCYTAATGLSPKAYPCVPSEGAAVVYG